MTKSQRSFLISSMTLGLYWCAIFAATHVPVPKSGFVGRPRIPHFDKIVHLGIYAFLGFLLLWFLSHGQRAFRAATAMTVGLIIVYGLLDEFLQSFVPTRHADPLDFVADLCGGALGVIAFVIIRARMQRSLKQNNKAVALPSGRPS